MIAESQNKTLVAYYSWSGKTKTIANFIQELTGADIFCIEPLDAYIQDYSACCDQAKEEINRGYHPELKDTVENIEQYDTIYIGTPNWWSTMAPPVATFLASHDLKGKTVIPFCTYGGGGKGHIFTDMNKLCPEVNTLKGFVCSGSIAKSAKNEIKTWLIN